MLTAMAEPTKDSGTDSNFACDHPWQPWVVCLSASLFFFFIFIQVNMFNAIGPALLKGFHISAARLGNLSASYFYANIIFLLPAGIILDRVSTRKLIIMAMSASIVGTLSFAMSAVVWQAELSRFAIGIAGSFCLLSNVRLASRWFEPRRMALVVGLVVTLAMTGGMVAQTPLTLLTDALGWRVALIVDAVFGLLLLLCIIAFVRDYPTGRANVHHQEQSLLRGMGCWSALLATAKKKQNWLAGCYTSLMNLPIFLLGAMWGGLYLMQVRGLTRAHASLVTTMLFVGAIIGSPIMGWVSDRLRRRRLPMMIAAIMALILILALMYLPAIPFAALMALFFSLGFITSTQIIGYPLIAESNPLALTGTAEGLASTLIMAGGLTQPLFAKLMQWHWGYQYVNHVPLFSHSNYLWALTVMPVAFTFGLAAVFFIRETRCRPFQQTENKKPMIELADAISYKQEML